MTATTLSLAAVQVFPSHRLYFGRRWCVSPYALPRVAEWLIPDCILALASVAVESQPSALAIVQHSEGSCCQCWVIDTREQYCGWEGLHCWCRCGWFMSSQRHAGWRGRGEYGLGYGRCWDCCSPQSVDRLQISFSFLPSILRLQEMR